MATQARALVCILGFLCLLWAAPSRAIRPQDVSVPFWEPLPFASLPEIIGTKAIFYQDNSTQGKVYTVAGEQAEAVATFGAVNKIFRMNVATETWETIVPSGDTLTPRVHHSLALVTDPVTGVSYIAIYGGYVVVQFGGSLVAFAKQDFALLDLSTHEMINRGAYEQGSLYGGVITWDDWTCCEDCAAADCPPPRAQHRMLTFRRDDPQYHEDDMARFYMLGGQTVLGGTLSDLWRYDIRDDSWEELEITNAIDPPRFGSAVAALSHTPTRGILVFSGWYVDGGAVSAGADLWLLSQTANDESAPWTWTQLMPADASWGPPARVDALHELVDDLFLLWGGDSIEQSQMFGGPMWVLDTSDAAAPEGWNWTTIEVDEFEPAPLTGSGLVYVPTQGAMLSVGGVGEGGISTDRLFKFHAGGLFPPVVTGPGEEVDDGFDFEGDNTTLLNFTQNAPNFFVRPKQSSLVASLGFGDQRLNARFVRLVELSAAGSPIQNRELLLPESDFVVGYELTGASAEGMKVTVFTRQGVEEDEASGSVLAATVRFEFYQFLADVALDALGLADDEAAGLNLTRVDFPLKAGEMKFNCRLANWPFLSSENKLRLDLELSLVNQDADNNKVTFATETGEDSPISTALLRSGGGIEARLGLVDVSLNDKSATAGVDVRLARIKGVKGGLRVSFTFSHFDSELYYDPSLGALFGEPSESSDDEDDDQQRLIIGVAVGASVGVALLAVLAAVAVLGVFAYKNKGAVQHRLNTMSRMMRTESGSDIPLQ